MRNYFRFLIVFSVIFSGLMNNVDAWGRKVTFYVYSDRGVSDDLTKKGRKVFKNIGEYLEDDLFERLEDSGFKYKRIRKREKFQKKKQTCLLYVTIMNYERGGNPDHYLEIHYEVCADGKTPVIQENINTGSESSWKKCVKKLNKYIVQTLGENEKMLIAYDIK